MTRLRNLLLVGILVGVVIGLVLTAGAQQKVQKPMPWEYRDGANLTMEQLNTLGTEGWELVTAVQYDKNIYYILRRPRP
jgi:hypothetical protein